MRIGDRSGAPAIARPGSAGAAQAGGLGVRLSIETHSAWLGEPRCLLRAAMGGHGVVGVVPLVHDLPMFTPIDAQSAMGAHQKEVSFEGPIMGDLSRIKFGLESFFIP